MADINNDGVVDDLDKLLHHPQFATDNWDKRRTMIYRWLIYATLACAAILGVFLWAAGVSIYRGTPVEMHSGVSDLLSAAFFALVTFIASGIGSYVFGAQIDVNSFRSTLTTLAAQRMSKATNTE